jgi:hypothetical protein
MSIRIIRGGALLGVAALLVMAGRIEADSVQLVNGDMLNGRVVGLDEQQLRLESDVHGKLSIPRAKVVSITFGDRKPAPAPVAAPAAANPLVPTSSVDDILKQLRAGAVGQNDVGEIQKMIPLLTNPDAFQYFSNKLSGLKDGSLSVQDIRKEALRARAMVKDLNLGPEAEQALSPYLGILDRFLRESDPSRGAPAKTPEKK